MSKDLQRGTKLLIISDTGMFKKNNQRYAFGPVVKEVDFFLKKYKHITWLGFNKSYELNNKSYQVINKKNVEIIMLPRIGGQSILAKLQILIKYPKMFLIIYKLLKTHQYIHVRAPSHPAIITMFLSYFFPKKQFWFKYAGSWVDKASKYYEFQRYILKHLNKNAKITVNGKWPNKNKNILSFENPCLNNNERLIGKGSFIQKNITGNINYCFVGALNKHKGVHLIIESLIQLNENNRIGTFHFVGDGPDKEKFEKEAKKTAIPVIFHGFLNKQEINNIYSQSHYIVLPSKSEGFPKVIGESMNFGCVPIVSDVSAIGQYIKDKQNGFLIKPLNTSMLLKAFIDSLNLNNLVYKKMQQINYDIANKFTYNYYIERINKEIYH